MKNWPASTVEKRRVEDLIPYARNARTHSDEQIGQIAASMQEWGWTNPCLIDEDNTILAGHGRVLAAQKLGIEEAPVMVARGWTEPQKRAYVIADNRLALNAGWSMEALAAEFAELIDADFDVELTGFDKAEIDNLMAEDLEEDTPPERPEDPVTMRGDVWCLAGHRVCCGDATSADDVERLLGETVPRLMVTDPPYGVNYDPSWRKDVGINKSDRMGRVQNDDRADWTEAWSLFPGDVAYVWHGALHSSDVARSLIECDLEVRSQIIWNKSRFAISRGAYHWSHEPCWYTVRKGRKAHWAGDRKQTTVWDVQSTNDGDTNVHGTQKPLECMGRPMRNHDAPEVYDPFLGSGSTLIAAEDLGRTCYGMDLDPAYVDVAVLRWENRTGQKATLDGKTYDEWKEERLAVKA